MNWSRREFFGAAAITGALIGRVGAESQLKNLSAASFGYFLPEESEPHARTFMQWPVNRQVHPDPVFLDILQGTIARIANTIIEFEPLVMLMDASHEKAARRRLDSRIEIWNIATDDLWCRDSGPVFVVNGQGELAVSQLNFNGWGGRQTHISDGKIAKAVAERLGIPIFESGLSGEGGGVESDGSGTLIAHESSWVNENRNKGSRAKIEQQLLSALGASKMIWAPGLKDLDITDYHIDTLARFVRPGEVVIQLPARVFYGDPWSAAAYETYEILKNAKDSGGNLLNCTIVPEPEPERRRIKSEDFVASYVNYYLCNGALIAPQFGDANTDQQAKDILMDLYPDREIVMLDTDPVGEVGGGIHCATQQQPVV